MTLGTQSTKKKKLKGKELINNYNYLLIVKLILK